MNNPAVSVVMSVFNGDRFLADAITSILGQSFRDFEFIIIDDGSADRSAAILKEYEHIDARVRVYTQQNRGLVESLNRGCAFARGKYIARMDADDIALKDRLSRQVAFLEENPQVAVLGGAVELINTDGAVLRTSVNPLTDSDIKKCLDNCPFWHSTVVIRKSALLAVGGYRKVVVDAEDNDLWLRMGEKFELANLPQVLLQYRVHNAQVSTRKCRQMALSGLAACAAAKWRAEGKADPLDTITEITADTLTSLGVSEAAQQTAVATRYLWGIRHMCNNGDFVSAAHLATELTSTSGLRELSTVEKHVGSELQLQIARLSWHENRFFQSMLFASKAIAARPIVLGRPLKPLLRRLRLLDAN